jgi:hypothetical protein
MAVVIVPVAEGIAALAAGAIAALSAHILLEAVDIAPQVKERDCADTPEETECAQCKLGSGFLGQAAQPRYIAETNFVNYRYQLYIANLYADPERFFLTKFTDRTNPELNLTWESIKDFFREHGNTLTTTEWLYNGVWFDGFWRRYCTVVEAKGNYASLFPEPPKVGPDFAEFELKRWATSYKRQKIALIPAMPRAQLEWHFMQPSPWLKARKVGIQPARFTPLK